MRRNELNMVEMKTVFSFNQIYIDHWNKVIQDNNLSYIREFLNILDADALIK